MYSSVGRVIARSLSDAVVASLPVQTEVIPVLDGPMRAFDMSSEAAAILNATMNKLKTRGADPIIERMIGDITPDRIRESINYLTGVTSSIRCIPSSFVFSASGILFLSVSLLFTFRQLLDFPFSVCLRITLLALSLVAHPSSRLVCHVYDWRQEQETPPSCKYSGGPP